MDILIRGISPTTIKMIESKAPAVTRSLILRALIYHALTLTKEQMAELVNKQATNELKERGLVKS